MTFLILYPINDGVYAGMSVTNANLDEGLARITREHPEAFVAEQLTGAAAEKSGGVPGELARAIEAWNAMPNEVTVPRLRGNLSRFNGPYRKWKREAGARNYLLEQLVADVIATPFCWPWIRFSWLFGKKNGELNSEKLRSGQWKDAAPVGKVTQAEYLRLSGRVAEWMRKYRETAVGADDETFNQRFEAELGLSWPKFIELRRQFNGSASV